MTRVFAKIGKVELDDVKFGTNKTTNKTTAAKVKFVASYNYNLITKELHLSQKTIAISKYFHLLLVILGKL